MFLGALRGRGVINGETLAENIRRYWREHLVHVAVAGLASASWCEGAGQSIRQVCWLLEQAGHHQL